MSGPMSSTGVSGVIREAWAGKKKPKDAVKTQWKPTAKK